MTMLISILGGDPVRLLGERLSPRWGIAQSCTNRHQGRMGGVVSGRVVALGLVAATAIAGPACAAGNKPTVTINGGTTSTITVGNVIVPPGGGTLTADPSTGAVSGTATRVTSGNLPVQNVTVSCNATPGNCHGTYTATTTTSVSGQATAISLTVSDLVCPLPATCTQTPTSLSINNGNNGNFTVTFKIGYTVTLTQLPHSVTGWSFNVKGTP